MKYNRTLIAQAKDLFPNESALHKMMETGDRRAVDFLYSKINFYVDEDLIVRAFSSKKEQKLFDMAKRAKSIRELYTKVFEVVSSNSPNCVV